MQGAGWQKDKAGWSVRIGTTGKSRRIEALYINRPSEDLTGNIVYQAHVQGIGWQGRRKNGKVAGTVGRGKRVEALRVYLTGELAQKYDVWYRAHVSSVGWLAWTCNGQSAGTQGQSRKVEAFQVALVPKDAGTPNASDQAASTPFAGAGTAWYRAYEKGSWKKTVSSGKTAGTVGKSVPIQAIEAGAVGEGMDGALRYAVRTGDAWQAWCEGQPTDATGVRYVQAMRFSLTGDLARFYDVWYRAHVQKVGWLGWAKNGQDSGSTESTLAVEAYQLRLVPKGQPAPGSTTRRTVDSVSVYYHDVPWVAQPNDHYCGPASALMVLRKLGITKSPTGVPLNMDTVAWSLNTTDGGTGFTNLDFENGMNYWLGRRVYRSHAYPSYEQLRSEVLKSFRTGYPVVLFAHERRGHAHYNAHNDSTYSHIIVIDGYNALTDAVYIADPGASDILWPEAKPKFWYPSLRKFQQEFLTPYPWRNDYGMIVGS